MPHLRTVGTDHESRRRSQTRKHPACNLRELSDKELLERVTELEKKGKKPSASRWEEVVLLPHHVKRQINEIKGLKVHEN